MPMIMVGPKVYEGGKLPLSPVLADMRKRYALTGLGLDCQWDENTGQFVGDCASYGMDSNGNPLVKTTGAPGSSAWTEAVLGLSKVFGQAYLNEHQAKVMQTNAQGTTVFQQSGVSPTGTANVGLPGGQNLATGLGVALGSTPMLIGLGVLAAVLLSRR